MYRPRRKRKPRTPRPVRTYEVTYTYLGAESVIHDTFRLRCPQLTPKQLVDASALRGEVATRRANGTWTAFTPGGLPDNAHAPRMIREIVEPPQLVEVAKT